MARRRAVLDISASRLELAVFNGGDAPAVHAQRICIGDIGENWPACLEAVTPQLAAMVRTAGAMGLETTVIYQAPSSAVLVTPVHAGAGRTEAQQAASLALADAANRALADGPHDLERIWHDPEPTGDKPEVPNRQSHFLGIADTEDSAAALAKFIRAAGLSPVALIPAEAIGLVAAADAAVERSKSSKGTAIALHVGEHISTLAAATSGRLRLVRRIGTGTEMLVDALAREIKPAAPDAPPVTLDRTQAAAALFRNGIPVRGKPFDESIGVNADAVLPLIQPVLQRCIVEIKQSLRFGLDEKERGGAVIIGLGTGTRIGRLVQVIAEQCGLGAETPALGEPASGPPSSTAGGLIHSWTHGRSLSVGLVPAFLGREQTVRRVRRGMLVGFGAAAAFVVYSAVTVRMDLAAQLKRVDTARVSLEAAKPMTDLNAKMMAAQFAVAGAKQRISSRMAAATSWDGAMFALSQCTPSTVKINECQMLLDHGKPVCRIVGQTPMPSSGDANGVLRSFLDALGGVPLVKSTRLGATQRIDTDRGSIQSFEMTISLHEIPSTGAEAPAPLANVTGAASGGAGGTP